MDADGRPVFDQVRGTLHPDDGGQAILPCDHRAVCHEPAHLRHQALDGDEQRRPAGVGAGGDENVARLEVGFGEVLNDAGAPLDGPGGDGQADERAGREMVAVVHPADDLAV